MPVTEQLNVPVLIARPAFRVRDDVIEVQVGCPEETDVAAHAAITLADADLDVLRDVAGVGARDRVRGDEAQRPIRAKSLDGWSSATDSARQRTSCRASLERNPLVASGAFGPEAG